MAVLRFTFARFSHVTNPIRPCLDRFIGARAYILKWRGQDHKCFELGVQFMRYALFVINWQCASV